MRVKSLVCLLGVFLLIAPLALSQSRETGAIGGTVLDDEGVPLPGVTMSVTSPNLIRPRSMMTDASGQFRFPALPPGFYAIKVELAGFGSQIRENVRVTTTASLSIDFTLAPASLQEEVTVVAVSPTIDVKSTETASVTLGSDILMNMPFSNFAMDIVNLAPGVNDNVAYGASSSTGISYQIDGVDVSDPEAGSAWVFNDPNIVEEAKIMGVGLPAEYGNFTGVIFNLVTKSGGNEFSGMTQFFYQGDKWLNDNYDAYIDDFPDLSSSGEAIFDIAGNLGGPIVKDKVWFFFGAQYYRSKNYVTGFPEAVDYKQPRAFLKLTAQLTNKTSINSFLEYDAYNGINRGASVTSAPDATLNQVSPDIVGNFSLTHIFSERTFFDIKAAFFHGYYYLDPEAGDVAAHYNINDNMRYDSRGYFFYADRDRIQANTSVTHYAEDFLGGDHDFKFGVEFEYGNVRNRFGYTGPNAYYYVDYTGYGPYGYYYTGNYLAYQYEGYDTKTKYTRLEGFVQDSWKIGDRLNISIGARLSQLWGGVQTKGNVYNNFRLAPRVGFTYDLLGDKSTILKAHFGQFTEAMLTAFHDRLNPASAYQDYTGFFWDTIGQEWIEWFRVEYEDLYTLDSNIKHPYMNQYTVSVERELFKDTSLSVTYINREWKNIWGRVDSKALYEPVEVFIPELNKTFTVYNQTNPGEHAYLLKNIVKGDTNISLDPYRKYQGLQFTFHKRFSNKWQLLASYVYSKATGTLDNGFADDIGWGGSTDDPNFWINADGESTNSPTHQVKIQGTYVLPFGIQFNAYFRAISGDTWTTRYRTQRFGQGRVTFFTEDRGSNRYETGMLLDLRLEKTFTLAGKYRIGVIGDVFNVFNDDTVTSWGTRIGYDWIPGDYASTSGHELYGITAARQYRVGIRFMF
ncbi:MAG: TonB-dependent receptor [Acidobacteriota bacterium]